MDSFHRSNRIRPQFLGYVTLLLALAVVGCASPGPPRAPSLNLPEPVRDLSVTRTGNGVELGFTAPGRTTDKLPLPATVTGELCRQLESEPCLPVASSKATIATGVTHNPIIWTDTLPPALTLGPSRLLIYRVEFFSPSGRSAGQSNSAFTAAGLPPLPVENLQAEGSRLGVVITWDPADQPGNIILKRENLTSALPNPPSQHNFSTKPTPTVVWLGTNTAAASSSPRTLDTTALPDIAYRYLAQRRASVQLGNHAVELLSSLSVPVTFTLHEIYPPPPPTGLTAVGFFTTPPLPDVPPTFAVDLVWQPVHDAGQTAALAGYNVYREAIDPTLDPRDRLNPSPIPTPAFHDTSADPAARYRYSVTAVDAKGNESAAATVLLDPSSKH